MKMDIKLSVYPVQSLHLGRKYIFLPVMRIREIRNYGSHSKHISRLRSDNSKRPKIKHLGVIDKKTKIFSRMIYNGLNKLTYSRRKYYCYHQNTKYFF